MHLFSNKRPYFGLGDLGELPAVMREAESFSKLPVFNLLGKLIVLPALQSIAVSLLFPFPIYFYSFLIVLGG